MSSVMNNELNPHVVLVPIGTRAATVTLPGLHARKKLRIKKVHLLNGAGITADNTNFLQVSLQDLLAVEYATLDTRAANQGAVVANTAKELAKSVGKLATDNSGELEVPALTNLQLVVTKNGTAVPTDATLSIEYYPL